MSQFSLCRSTPKKISCLWLDKGNNRYVIHNVNSNSIAALQGYPYHARSMTKDPTIKDVVNEIQKHASIARSERKAIEKRLSGRIGGLEERIGNLDERVDSLKKKVDEGFEEARLHRMALQEDLEATILVQGAHKKKLQMIE